MPFPERERFSIMNLVKRWNISEEEVCEWIRAGHFNHLIIVYPNGFISHYFIRMVLCNPPGAGLSRSSLPRVMSWYLYSIEEFPWPEEKSNLYVSRREIESCRLLVRSLPSGRALSPCICCNLLPRSSESWWRLCGVGVAQDIRSDSSRPEVQQQTHRLL